MTHSSATIQELATIIQKFRIARKRNGSTPEDIAKSIIIEGAELLEHFQRDTTVRKRDMDLAAKKKEDIASEVADIFIYLMMFCEESEIDMVEAVKTKLDKLEKKYPKDYKNGKKGHEEYLKLKKEHRKNN